MKWMDDAACNGMDVDEFFPPQGQSTRDTFAVLVCKVCPVVNECLTFALETHAWGIWAGTNEKDRLAIRKKQQKAALNARLRGQAA